MKRILTLLTFLTLTSTFSYAQNSDEQQIRTILTNQTKFWNLGNIDAFMQGYWKSDSLLFVGSKGPTYGYQRTLDNYKKTYPDKAHMGTLSFDILKVERISTDRYFVLGKWMLNRTAGDVSGFYTLLFRKFGKEWLIIVDHSS